MGRLEGKVAIITGGALGIGEAVARLFALEGAKVAVADIKKAEGEKVTEGIKKEGGEAIFIKLDVTQEKDWIEGIDEVIRKYGKLNILVNNAGVNVVVPLEETSLEQWNWLMNVNATGVFLGTKYAIKAMKNNGEQCSIINRSSTAAMFGSNMMAAYGATKGAVLALTKAAAIACAQSGYTIRVNSVHPALVNTPMAEQEAKEFGLSLKEYQEKRRQNYPIGRIGEPIDIAYMDLYLASDESSWVTGSTFVVDGGLTAR